MCIRDRKIAAVAAVNADADADADAAAAAAARLRLVESNTQTVRDCLADEVCLKAISMASLDALAIAQVGVGVGAARETATAK